MTEEARGAISVLWIVAFIFCLVRGIPLIFYFIAWCFFALAWGAFVGLDDPESQPSQRAGEQSRNPDGGNSPL